MDVDIFAGLRRAASLPVPATPASLTAALADTGWTPTGATAEPYPRTWDHGDARAVVYPEATGAFLDVVAYAIAPGWENPEFSAAVRSDFESERDRLNAVTAAVLAAVTGSAPAAGSATGPEAGSEADGPQPVPDDSETAAAVAFDADFVESRQWLVRDWRLTVGIRYLDEDLPIMVVARLEPR